MTISERNGSYQSKVRKTKNGKVILNESRTFDTLAKATAWEAEMLQNFKTGTEPSPISVPFSTCIQDAWEKWAKKNPITEESTDSQKNTYKSNLNRSENLKASFLGKIPAEKLNRGHVAQYIRERIANDGVAESTVMIDVSVIANAAKAARDYNIKIDSDTYENHDLQKSKSKYRVFVDDEEERLINALRKSKSKIAYPIYRLLIETGARIGEIESLQIKDIDLSNRFITLRKEKTKTKQERFVPLSQNAMITIQCYIAQYHTNPKSEDFLFNTKVKSYYSLFVNACKSAKIVKLSVHDLRHIALTRLAKVYSNPMDLAKVSGHRDLNTLLNTYYNTTGHDLVQIMKDFETRKENENA